MGEFTKGVLIAMQKNLGLGHRGDILLTTQERIDNNLEPLAKDVFSKATAKDFVCRWNEWPDLKQQRDDLLTACERKKKVVIAMEGNVVWEANYGYMEDAIAKAKP